MDHQGRWDYSKAPVEQIAMLSRPQGLCEGEMKSSAGQEIVYTAWPHRPLNSLGLSGRLGIVYCVNRACALHCTSLSSGCAPSSEVCNL